MYKTFRKIDKSFVPAYRNFVKEILNKFMMNNTVFITGASSGFRSEGLQQDLFPAYTTARNLQWKDFQKLYILKFLHLESM